MTPVSRPITKAGQRLLWMFATERMPSGRRVPAAFDARLAERIVQDFVTAIEDEAVAMAESGQARSDRART